jgi:hypothetical protein
MKKINPRIYLTVWTYLGWFGCVYLGKMNWGLASFIFPMVSWILLRLSFNLNRLMMLRLLVLFLIGLSFDSGAVFFNLVQINPPATIGWLPSWMISLWLLFIASLPLLQSLFQKKYFLAALFGAIFGPLSYRAGTQFESLNMNGTQALLIYALFWAIYTPLAMGLIGRKDITNENT